MMDCMKDRVGEVPVEMNKEWDKIQFRQTIVVTSFLKYLQDMSIQEVNGGRRKGGCYWKEGSWR